MAQDCASHLLHETKLECDQQYAQKTKSLEKALKSQAILGHRHPELKSQNILEPCSGTEDLLEIPVVVHIVHANQALGSSENPTDTEVMAVLNGTNSRFRNASGATFANPLSGVDMNIELVLAKRDPNGNATTGIERINNSSTALNVFNVNNTQNAHFWPTDRYLNIYLVKDICLSCPGSTYTSGYSSLVGSHGNDDDGIVIKVDDFWVGLLCHEVGHYGNLRHVFLGNSCINNDCLSDGDRVCDTPPKDIAGLNTGLCGAPGNSCSTDDDDSNSYNPYRPVFAGGIGDVNDILENYMDYTGGCWEAFTVGQKERWRNAIKIARGSILDSDATIPVSSVEAGISSVIFPTDQVCGNSFQPIIEIKNQGNNTLTSAQISISIDGAASQSAGTWTGSLPSGATAQYTLPNQPISNFGTIEMEVTIDNPNGNGDDAYDLNDVFCQVFERSAGITDFPYCEDHESASEWIIRNPDSDITFVVEAQTACDASDNNHLRFPSWGNAIDPTRKDALLSKAMDFSNFQEVSFEFDVAYVQSAGNTHTVLDVSVSTNCGGSYTSVYNKTGVDLASTGGSSAFGAWSPANCTQWKTELINLDSYAGMNEVIIQMEVSSANVNGTSTYFFGQDLYLDNLCVEGRLNCAPPRPIVTEPTGALCGVLPTLLASSPIPSGFSNYSYQWYLDGVALSNSNSQSMTASVVGNFQVRLISPNGNCDSPLSAIYAVAPANSISSPNFCESFESGLPSDWRFESGSAGADWMNGSVSGCSSNGGSALILRPSSILSGPALFRIESPVLDLTNRSNAELNFDISHRRPAFCNWIMSMDISVSTDCGGSWNSVYSKNDHYPSGAGVCLPVATTPSSSPLHTELQGSTFPSGMDPASCSNWRNDVVNLSSYSGKTILLRFEVELASSLAEDLFIDNICVSSSSCSTNTFYADVDGDTFGDSNFPLSLCSGAGLVTIGQDCNDGNAAVNPNATEVADGVDNDCDSSIDEGFGSRLFMTALLEGNYQTSSNEMTTTLNSNGLLPLSQPYSVSPWNVAGVASLPNQAAIPNDAVDYVLVEARQGTPANSGGPNTNMVERQVGFLLKNGSIVSLDGSMGLSFTTLTAGQNYYFLLRHRNHLDVMTANPITASSSMTHNFTSGFSAAYGPEQVKDLGNGRFALHAGDFVPDASIQNTDYDAWFVDPSVLNSYKMQDGNLDGVVQNTDYDTWFLNKAKLGHNEVNLP